MRLHLSKPIFLPCLALAWLMLSCDKDLTSSEDQPRVDYVLIVTDSISSAPLENVKVRVTSINGDTSTYFTDRLEGRAELATLASSRTLFILSKTGYRTLDLLDTVNAKPDTLFNRSVQRLLKARMVSLNPDQGRVQVQLHVRNLDAQRLRRARVTFTDSTGTEQTVTDNDSDGTVGLSGLDIGKSLVKVEHSSYLGRLVEVTVDKADTSRKAVSVTVILQDLGSNISGQVYYKTAGGSKALVDAKVEFHLKDSLASPRFFRTHTSADAGLNGRFVFENVPGLDGELRFFKDRPSVEPVKRLALTREEVMLEGPIPLVTLTILSDSLLPLLISGPAKSPLAKDTIGSKDTLEFKLNQAVGEIQSLKVKLINESELLISSSLSTDKSLLKVWQKEAGWIEGKKYEYELALANAQGERFTIPGDSDQVIRGTYLVRITPAVSDSSLLFPRDIRFAYFNSGGHYLFGSVDTNTSPKADSTSQFGRLKWTWDDGKGKGRRVDSLLIFFKDGKSAVNWTLWGSLPGFLDSANLSFSDHYSTVVVPSQKPRFPVRDSSGEIFFMVRPKDGGRSIDAEDTTLEAVNQGMGPTVYVVYKADSLKFGEDDVDSVEITFETRSGSQSTVKAWGASAIRPTPRLYMNDKLIADTTVLKWRWVDNEGKKGFLVYRLPSMIAETTRLRVDLNGEKYLGKPIWMRNPHDKKVLPK